MTTAQDAIDNELGRWSHCDRLSENGILFLCHLVKEQEFRYLHKIYPPMPDMTSSKIIDYLGFEPPNDYLDLLSTKGGVALFDNVFYIFGYDPFVRRTLNLADQKPIYIGTEHVDFSWENPEIFKNGWRLIGSVVLEERHPIVLNERGECAMVFGKELKIFTSFSNCITTTIEFLAHNIGCRPVSVEFVSALEMQFSNIEAR